MQQSKLFKAFYEKQSLLCVGLDTDKARIPTILHSERDPVYHFNKQIIDATQSFAVAYKFNIAFYESMGTKGWEVLEKTLAYIPSDIFTIADAKRGDIGNTSRMYAQTFFQTYDFDAITVAPYMGYDSVAPFLDFPDKWVFVLALTSNEGAKDFQFYGSPPLYQQVISTALAWEKQHPAHLGLVIGATRNDQLKNIRQVAPQSLCLIPGVGTQGGDLAAVCNAMLLPDAGILINSSRGIIYASEKGDFAEAAARQAALLQQQMAPFTAVYQAF